MKKQFLIALALLLLLIGCSSSENFQVLHQVTGGIDTNCYLIYGEKTREAALIDVAGPIDTLLQHIRDNNLKVVYFLFTHGHFDHVIGLPDIRDEFPEAAVVMHELDYKDMFTQKEWAINNLGEEFINYLKSDPEKLKIYDFDVQSFGVPDIFIQDNQNLEFGHLHFTAIHSPGHSPGSVCYSIDSILFSGDVLFYRSVGRTDVQNSSREAQIKSVRRLYDLFPENTAVYPGHGKFTDIGSEKNENKKITTNEVFF